MARSYDDALRLQTVLEAADSDLITLLEAVAAVIQERHPDQEAAQIEAVDFAERLYTSIGKLNLRVL